MSAVAIKPQPLSAPDATHPAPEDLRDLMQVVAETTQRLQATHVSLQNQVTRLQKELADANAALRRSQALAALGEMAAGIAHEVRNPLGSIQLYVQMLAEDLRDRPAQAELCIKIDRAVIGLDAIVRDVLAFARHMSIDPHPITTDELFNRALANCQALVGKHVRIIQRADCPAMQIVADPGLLTQALSNVIRNAIEAMHEHDVVQPQLTLITARQKIRTSAGRQENRTILAVEDCGPGIDPQVVDRLFNPFFTTRKTGTGLGLAIVHRIIDAHGGEVIIQNTQSGGARVELRLPNKPPASQSSPQHNGVCAT